MSAEPSRRGFMQAGAFALSALTSGGMYQLESEDPDGTPYRGAAYLIGAREARPEPGDPFFENKQFGGYVYESFDGARWAIVDPFDEWDPLNNVNRIWVHSENDLPDPTGVTHSLVDGRVYTPVGFVPHQYPLELATTSPIVGTHGGVSGFIYTGAGSGRGAAIQGTDANFFMRDAYLHAPGATLFDLAANESTEMLVESYSTNDAAGFGNVASLGTIDGYRVPTFKGVNFGAFDDGLTFDGNPDKIAIFDSPFRNVTAANVDVLTFASTLDTDIVQIKGCYGKSFQSDTVFINAESGSLPDEVFQLIDTTFDSTVTQANILTGDVGLTTVGTYVGGCFPLRDSDVGGSLDDTNGPQTVTGSGAGEVRLGSTNLTTSISNADFVSQPTDGIIQYDGRRDRVVRVFGTCTVTGSNTEYEIGIVKNGIPAAGRTEALGYITNAATPDTTATVGEFAIEQGDQISMSLENTGGAADLDVETFSITI